MLTCPGCGASYADEFRFCPHCARPRPETPKVHVEVSEALAPNACPQCKRVDSVQKLSSIRAGGTQRTAGVSYTSGSSSIDGSTTYYSNSARVGSGQVSGSVLSSSSTSISAVAQSDLARVTAPPPEPQKPMKRISGAWIWIPIVALGGGLLITVAWMFNVSIGNNPLVVCGTPLLVWSLISGVIFAILTRLNEPSFEATEAKNIENTQQYILEYAAQQEALAVWNQLYYCHRDDIVFLPGTKYIVAPKDTMSLCYTLAQQKSS